MKRKILTKKINEAIADETKAPKDYAKLRKLVKGKTSKKQITTIIKQERKHRRKLLKIKKKEIKSRGGKK